MKKSIRKLFSRHLSPIVCHDSRGAGLGEVLIAMAVVAALTPYLISRITKAGDDVKDLGIAKNISAWHDPVSDYITRNRDLWRGLSVVEVDLDDIGFSNNVKPQSVTVYKTGRSTSAELDFSVPGNLLRLHNIAGMLGPDAEVDDDKLIFRISEDHIRQGNNTLLMRVSGLSSKKMSMERDLYMSKNSIKSVSSLTTAGTEATTFDTIDIASENLISKNVVFESAVSAISADIYDGLKIGAGAKAKGNIISDNLSAHSVSAKGLSIMGDAEIKNVSVRDRATFESLSAKNVSADDFASTDLSFANGFGITVSGDSMFSRNDGGLTIGSWSLSRDGPPAFRAIILQRMTGEFLPNTSDDFSKITTRGWKKR